MVLALIITNVGVFLLWGMADENTKVYTKVSALGFKKHKTPKYIVLIVISLDNFNSGHLHTLITNAFSHRNTFHIFSNMIGLYFFGRNKKFGSEFLLKLYLSGAVGGSGASGAVNAVMLLDIFLFPKATLYLNFFVPVPAVLLGIFLIGKDMLRILEGNSQISASAHLGGAAVAAIAWAGVRKGRF
ncbi:hypothetical protein JHK82_046908 [Glycine max]|uniref:Peptidase S54 rhomboid domain-containing protein n=2 Tax=Glycine subgen. Soja TaxID=1462606 RepID=A0A0R0FAC4_SOYBN|nr:hypothetical protein JHK86_046797 [Glycine max]KAG4932591.1 hypothetical protein JHK87_046593 [Glycine soja]KAG4942717.1 hypothetical protein JHK85_047363 [Glycine max]KAG5097054.1 hypothetical protein JHK82_046908 [Glycine max]KAG5101840.1 hypothetical protein JHK84_046809 [Glycine max]